MFSNKLRLLTAFLLTVGVGIYMADPALAQCEIAKLRASDTSAGDQLGTAVAVSGDTAIVGARENDHGATNTGSAYIFQRNEGGADHWGEVEKLTASDADAYDNFGRSVSICGDIAIAGAPGDDECGEDAGAAYMFQRDEGGPDNWGLVKKVVADDCALGHEFGHSVSCSGDTAIVGTPVADENAGATYVFQQCPEPDRWCAVQKLTCSTAEPYEGFGGSVSIDGTIAIVGAESDSTAAHHGGSACIFERDAGGADNWGEVKVLTASDAESGDNFGSSVSVSGDTTIVGAAGDDDAGRRSGSAYVFQQCPEPDGWCQVKKLTASASRHKFRYR